MVADRSLTIRSDASAHTSMKSCNLLGTHVNATSYDQACETIGSWIKERQSNYVCACNVHMIMEAYDNKDLRDLLNKAGMVTPDGMPLVWYMRRHGFPDQNRVCGPELMPELLAKAEACGWKVGLYGGHDETLEKLQERLTADYPKLDLAYVFSPPFRALTNQEVEDVRSEIRSTGVDLLFVSLGCPKQEMWMAEQRDHLSCVMIGVGAAFSFMAGTVKQAPPTMRRAGLEWLFRVCTEPKRLWRRYASTNPRFVALVLMPRLRRRRAPASDTVE